MADLERKAKRVIRHHPALPYAAQFYERTPHG
jgi:hypothetical protein